MQFGDLKIQMLIYRAYLKGFRHVDNIDRQCLCKNGSNCPIVQAAIDLSFSLGVGDRADKSKHPNGVLMKREKLADRLIELLGLEDGELTEVEHK